MDLRWVVFLMTGYFSSLRAKVTLAWSHWGVAVVIQSLRQAGIGTTDWLVVVKGIGKPKLARATSVFWTSTMMDQRQSGRRYIGWGASSGWVFQYDPFDGNNKWLWINAAVGTNLVKALPCRADSTSLVRLKISSVTIRRPAVFNDKIVA